MQLVYLFHHCFSTADQGKNKWFLLHAMKRKAVWITFYENGIDRIHICNHVRCADQEEVSEGGGVWISHFRENSNLLLRYQKKKKLLISLTNEITCGKILLSNLFHKFQDKYLMTVLRIILRISKVCFWKIYDVQVEQNVKRDGHISAYLFEFEFSTYL